MEDRHNWAVGNPIPIRIRGARNTDELTEAKYTLYSRRIDMYKIDLIDWKSKKEAIKGYHNVDPSVNQAGPTITNKDKEQSSER